MRVLFLEATTEVLVRRYESTRRRHPRGAGEQLAEAIEQERALLEPVKAEADVVVDTTDLNVHQLRDRIAELFGDGERDEHHMQTDVLSFGYKHGLPTDVDIVLDCRFLPNPHWVDELRPLTGLDPAVRGLRARPGRRAAVPRPARRACSTCCCPRTWPRARRT